mgnify:CR=1 FL=1
MRNAEVARLFEEYADLLEAQDDEYRPRSYRRAAENIRGHPEPIEELAAEGQEALEEIEGVGDSIAAKIVEYVETGRVERIEEAREDLPVDMEGLTGVEGVGPKTVGDLYEHLGITTLDELEAAATAGKIQEVPGYGEKSEQNILDGIAFARQAGERELLGDARPLGEEAVEYLLTTEAVSACELGGSLRRWRETIGDVDVLASGEDHEAVVDALLDWERVTDEIESGSAKASVRVGDMRVDLRVIDPHEWGSALVYFTGSKDHNVRLRNYAIAREMKVNEYGVFDVSDVAEEDAGPRVGERVAGDTEEDVYAALDLDLIPPELREDNGEIDAAAAGELPDLLELDALRGDLHVHTDWSDGGHTIEEMVDGAAEFGHDYVCISDHAEGPGVVGGAGLSDADLREQRAAIEAVAASAEIEVFAGVEANIDAEGGISVGDDVLEELDLVVASPHSGLDGDGTNRLIAAVEHPEVDVLGHPSGRLLNQRPGMQFDVEAVAGAAAANGVAIEVNGNPHRLDLWGEAVRVAIGAGATIAIDTDAHRPGDYHFARYGVHTARRGWAEAGDVVNTRDADGLRDALGG